MLAWGPADAGVDLSFFLSFLLSFLLARLGASSAAHTAGANTSHHVARHGKPFAGSSKTVLVSRSAWEQKHCTYLTQCSRVAMSVNPKALVRGLVRASATPAAATPASFRHPTRSATLGLLGSSTESLFVP
jgi:hypothetical protein